MDVRERMAAGLACLALDSRLGGLLLFDLEPGLVPSLARWLAAFLGGSTAVRMLGPAAAADELWLRVVSAPGNRGIGLQPGPLNGHDRPPAVIVVPDLAQLDLGASRAAVTTVGADVAHLERDGLSLRWRPEDRWLACCRREEVGRVSRHLLDRFAVRVDAHGFEGVPDVGGFAAGAADERRRVSVLDDPAPAWSSALRAGRIPGTSDSALRHVVGCLPPARSGSRRDLALARIARALAALEGESVVEPRHVDLAARNYGFASASVREPDRATRSPEPARPAARANAGAGQGTPAIELSPPEIPLELGGGLPEALDLNPLPDIPRALLAAYPEDAAYYDSDVGLLRATWHRLPGELLHGGHPIGTQPAREVRDVSVSATLFAAAKYQQIRCRRAGHRPDGHPLHVSPADIHSYRRSPVPAYLMVLLLDHTCRRDWDWSGALAPFLQWGYALRASVGVVELGSADAPQELRARQFTARNLLDPRVVRALDTRSPGSATPLAHGLSLAGQLLRRGVQQGGVPITEAVLLAVTDGRGNVPLAASQTSTMPPHVAREGVEDALEAARLIARINRVRSIVVDPGPRPNAHLNRALAEALTGVLVQPGADYPEKPGDDDG
jgi:magnesium chelatase subunit D